MLTTVSLATRKKRFLDLMLCEAFFLAWFAVLCLLLGGVFNDQFIGIMINQGFYSTEFLLFLLQYAQTAGWLLLTCIYCGMDFYYLCRDGQSIIKKIIGVKIISNNGDKASFWKTLIIRRGLFVLWLFIDFFIGYFPIAMIFIDGCFVLFRADKRSLRDLFAGTIIIELK
ncbi:MAG: RDD family protein [Synergistaceae bacterium]|jgi:uncharacterized RDD family membrane protein YckC|nr:RDD family protein [Synergistaceae bacterium]